jgi:ketosteroid isomerase-like protein
MKLLTLILFLAISPAAYAFDSPQALQDGFMAAMRANDIKGLAACYTVDATNFAIDSMSGTGPESVRASWGGFFEAFTVTAAELSDDHLEVSGDLAAAWGLFTITAVPVGGGEAVIFKGRYMDVAKNFDGSWLYVADHASMPMPAEEEEVMGSE